MFYNSVLHKFTVDIDNEQWRYLCLTCLINDRFCSGKNAVCSDNTVIVIRMLAGINKSKINTILSKYHVVSGSQSS